MAWADWRCQPAPQEDRASVYGCEVLWDEQDAKRVHELMEQGTGKPCPGEVGKRCPLLPKTLAVVRRPT